MIVSLVGRSLTFVRERGTRVGCPLNIGWPLIRVLAGSHGQRPWLLGRGQLSSCRLGDYRRLGRHGGRKENFGMPCAWAGAQQAVSTPCYTCLQAAVLQTVVSSACSGRWALMVRSDRAWGACPSRVSRGVFLGASIRQRQVGSIDWFAQAAYCRRKPTDSKSPRRRATLGPRCALRTEAMGPKGPKFDFSQYKCTFPE